jgi:hypothetical protein
MHENLTENPNCFDEVQVKQLYPYIGILFFVPSPVPEDFYEYSWKSTFQTESGIPLEGRDVYDSGYTLETLQSLYEQWPLEDQIAFDKWLQSEYVEAFLFKQIENARNWRDPFSVSEKDSKRWEATIDGWFRYWKKHKKSARQQYIKERRESLWQRGYTITVENAKTRRKLNRMYQVCPPFYEYLRRCRGEHFELSRTPKRWWIG